MGWDRRRLLVALGVAALVVTSCGGAGGESTPTTVDAGGADTTIAGGEGDAAVTEQAGDEDGGDSGGESGERSAVISIDGEATSYRLDDVTYSNVDGVEDLTLETCDPDFFGSGRFHAIGYAVDDEGELLVDETGDLVGILTMDLPPDDWEATQRDEPSFELNLHDLDIEIASPDEAAGGTMSWTIEDTRASGAAVFVDFENTYTVDFEIVCEGSPTVEVDDPPTDDHSDAGDNGGRLPLAGAGVGSFTADGESFDNVDVYSCEPFSFGSDPHPDDVSLLAYLGGTSGLEVVITHGLGVDLSDGSQFDQIELSVFHSRQGESGLEQFEASAASAADGTWFTTDPDTLEQTPLDANPVVVEGDRVTGALAGLRQTWPDEGAATVDVTFDLEIPTEVNEEC